MMYCTTIVLFVDSKFLLLRFSGTQSLYQFRVLCVLAEILYDSTDFSKHAEVHKHTRNLLSVSLPQENIEYNLPQRRGPESSASPNSSGKRKSLGGGNLL